MFYTKCTECGATQLTEKPSFWGVSRIVCSNCSRPKEALTERALSQNPYYGINPDREPVDHTMPHEEPVDTLDSLRIEIDLLRARVDGLTLPV